MGDPKVVPSQKDPIARLVLFRFALADNSRAVDPRNMGEIGCNAGVSFAGKRVLVVERRALNVDRHLTRGQILFMDRLHRASNFVRSFSDKVARNTRAHNVSGRRGV